MYKFIGCIRTFGLHCMIVDVFYIELSLAEIYIGAIHPMGPSLISDLQSDCITVSQPGIWATFVYNVLTGWWPVFSTGTELGVAGWMGAPFDTGDRASDV